jgi:hypothetical protein
MLSMKSLTTPALVICTRISRQVDISGSVGV